MRRKVTVLTCDGISDVCCVQNVEEPGAEGRGHAVSRHRLHRYGREDKVHSLEGAWRLGATGA